MFEDEWTYSASEKNIMKKAVGTTSEIVIASLLDHGEKELKPAELKKLLVTQLHKIESASQLWGDVGSCVHPLLHSEAGSLATSPA